MKFALVTASILALGLTLVSGSTITPRGYYEDQYASCEYGSILENSTYTYDYYDIGFVAAYCPYACDGKKYDKRGGYYCSKDDCYLTCVEAYYYPIYPYDCQVILDYLSSYDSDTFTVPAETYFTWYYGTCEITYWNFDCYDYEVCYDTFEYNAALSVDTCVGSSYDYSYGAVCAGSGDYGDNYAIIVD